MQIFSIKIKNFRGIHHLDWHPNGRFLCLIGPNDSTKTTILEAIELVTLPRAYFTVTDVDFHKADTNKPIIIEATIGDLPVELLDEVSKYGLFLRGYDKAKQTIVDAPLDETEKVLTIRFMVDSELEPTWTVINAEDEKKITWQDRARLGVNHLGRDQDRHLTWARGSALARTTDKNGVPTSHVVASIAKQASSIFDSAPKAELEATTQDVSTRAAKLGAAFKLLKPGLDTSGLAFGASAFSLHDGAVPSRLWGLGTRRITALAAQHNGLGTDAVLLLDEIETGLEPHRVRHLVENLLKPDKNERQEGQVIFTTHSPSTVIPLPIDTLRFVRSNAGITTVENVAESHRNEMQSYSRTHSHALFARKILVCEGATEEGVCRGLADWWACDYKGLHPTHIGFVAINGRGNAAAPNVAVELKRLGYDVAYLGDDDEPMNPSAKALTEKGVPTFIWDGKMAIEERIAADLEVPDIQLLINKAIDIFGEIKVVAQINQFGGINVTGHEVADWILIEGEQKIRAAIGKASKKGQIDGGKGWFKNITLGISIGEIVGAASWKIPEAPLTKKLEEVTTWAYGKPSR